MSKSSKMVSLFLSTALIMSTIGCGPQQQIAFGQDGNSSSVEEEEDDDGFFGWFMAPFGFSKKHSSSALKSKSLGIKSGGSSVYPNSSGTGSTSTPNSKAGISTGGSNSTGGTGITSGTHGGIGGGGSSAS